MVRTLDVLFLCKHTDMQDAKDASYLAASEVCNNFLQLTNNNVAFHRLQHM